VDNNVTCAPVCPFPLLYSDEQAHALSVVGAVLSWISFCSIAIFVVLVLSYDNARRKFPANLPVFALIASAVVFSRFFFF
jgi:hypothetical protein